MKGDTKVKPGVCRFCGCTENNACVIDVGLMTITCSWVSSSRTVCSAPDCVRKLKKELGTTRARVPVPLHYRILNGVTVKPIQ